MGRTDLNPHPPGLILLVLPQEASRLWVRVLNLNLQIRKNAINMPVRAPAHQHCHFGRDKITNLLITRNLIFGRHYCHRTIQNSSGINRFRFLDVIQISGE